MGLLTEVALSTSAYEATAISDGFKVLLGDMSACVIKIEQAGRGDDTHAWGPPFPEQESGYFLSINRNKESVTLDFKQRAGRELLDRLGGGGGGGGRLWQGGRSGAANGAHSVGCETSLW